VIRQKDPVIGVRYRDRMEIEEKYKKERKDKKNKRQK
jgi:hypothetical protein